MAINDRIKDARKKIGYTQDQLGKLIGVAKSTVAGYERGSSEPSIDIIIKIMDALHVDANYLWQDSVQTFNSISASELELIRNFNMLDSQGQDTVLYIIKNEKKRCEQVNKMKNEVNELQEQIKEKVPTRILAYYGRIAAAGISFGFDDIIQNNTIEVPLTRESEYADFAIGVSGDSMLPTYEHGDIVLVKKVDHLNIGDVGIFQKDNGIYIKEVGENELISHNTSYKPIPNNGDIKRIGKVIGKIQI